MYGWLGWQEWADCSPAAAPVGNTAFMISCERLAVLLSYSVWGTLTLEQGGELWISCQRCWSHQQRLTTLLHTCTSFTGARLSTRPPPPPQLSMYALSTI